jgi:predicted DCC family thiol-disulfide oxidoreductase YuxK
MAWYLVKHRSKFTFTFLNKWTKVQTGQVLLNLRLLLTYQIQKPGQNEAYTRLRDNRFSIFRKDTVIEWTAGVNRPER